MIYDAAGSRMKVIMFTVKKIVMGESIGRPATGISIPGFRNIAETAISFFFMKYIKVHMI